MKKAIEKREESTWIKRAWRNKRTTYRSTFVRFDSGAKYCMLRAYNTKTGRTRGYIEFKLEAH